MVLNVCHRHLILKEKKKMIGIFVVTCLNPFDLISLATLSSRGYREQVKAMFLSVHLDDFVNFSKASLPGSNYTVNGIAEDSLYLGAFLAVYGNTILRITNDTVTDLFRSDINMTGEVMKY